ncbi:hypothetical protein [Bosea sp. NBC_00550]|uniref:hypothetical protein n=1 Tax=Bosea sp. NBC_00550 TaxID=2969621 RepID=UPI002231C652|nr:hypothetical protein [Bosea sp. NBC_00550]UZF90611.1 hypothetical protein NWE53_15855 [Bosea sp. NBC_00550]
MKPTIETYTVAIPWYQPEDFACLWAMALDGNDEPPDYEAWRRQALAVCNEWLARGRALQFVTVRPAALIAWLDERALANTSENRRRYVESLAMGKSTEAT